MLVCPECRSKKTWKDGLRYVQGTSIQRHLCRSCGYRFSDPSLNVSKDPECTQSVHRMALNLSSSLLSKRQICVLEKEMKNLTAEAKTQALQENRENTISQLVNFSLHLLKHGRSEATIKTYTKLLKTVKKHADLNDSEAVKEVIATRYKDRNTKRLVVCAYSSYLKFVGGEWIKPDYKPEHKQVFIPTEEELNLAINSGTKESVIYSKFLYESGARDNEASRLEWTDLDIERGQTTVKSSKNGESRIVSISDDLMNLLFSLPKTQKTAFVNSGKRTAAFHNRMQTLAEKHNNPRFLKIHLHTFRHCKALREYHKTRDILHVMGILGHRNINTTYRYVRLYNQIYTHQQKVKFITKIGSTKEERCELIKGGWDLVEKDGDDWYFKKSE